MRVELKRGLGVAGPLLLLVLCVVGLVQHLASGPFEGHSLLAGGRKWALWSSGSTQLRGANIYQRRVYAELSDATSLGNGVAGPPYVASDFTALASAGANLVVISHPGILTETPPYHLDEAVVTHLDRLVALAADAGLSVVISYRTGPGRSEFSILRSGAGEWFPPEMINDGVWSDATAQEGWCDMWRLTAERYASHPAVVGFELMMEPNASTVFGDGGNLSPADFFEAHGQGPHDWNLLYPRLVAAVREASTTIPVLVPAEGYGSIYWLNYLKPVDDPYCVYVVHHYVPTTYTHQSTGTYSSVTYPGFMGGQWVDERWLGVLNRRLQTFSSWHGVPVAVLEAGAHRWSPGASRFMADQLDDFEACGANWAVWLWECRHTNYTDEVNSFNFRLGPDPGSVEEVPDNPLYRTIQNYWGRNTQTP